MGIGSGTPVRPLTIDTQTGTTSLGGDAEVIKIAGSDADETYCGIGFHYDNSSGQTHSPAFMGYQAKNWAGSTNGDLVFATRSGTSDAAPTESMRITADGRGLSSFTARAWVSFNGTGTIAIVDSHNVSSLTDNGTGDSTITFTNSMPTTTYVTNATARWTEQRAGVYYGYQLAASTRVATCTAGTQTAADSDTVFAVVFGD